MESILTWLGDKKCLLLIDELNQIPHLEEGNEEVAQMFAQFLKENFLRSFGRYFIFSSHISVTGERLSQFMDSKSSRNIIVKQLPLICSLSETRQALGLKSLTAQQDLYYGMVPASIFASFVRNFNFISKIKRVFEYCVKLHLICNDKIFLLLRSFLTGKVDHAPFSN
jgi:hypothetical protein